MTMMRELSMTGGHPLMHLAARFSCGRVACCVFYGRYSEVCKTRGFGARASFCRAAPPLFGNLET